MGDGLRTAHRRSLGARVAVAVGLLVVVVGLLAGLWLAESDTPPPVSPTTDDGDDIASSAAGETYYLSPEGDDSAAGTEEQPWATLDQALATVVAGDTVVLTPGTYGERGTATDVSVSGSDGAPITFVGQPGAERPVLLGHYDFTGDHLEVSGLVFDGPTGEVKATSPENPGGEEVQVAVHGDDVTIENSVIRDSGWHAGIFLSEAEDAAITGNCITGNGDEAMPSQANTSHGVYWHSGSGNLSGNLVERNLARGIQLYEEPRNVTISDNVIVENGRAGIQFADETSDSVAEGNLVVSNGDIGIRSHSLSGTGNLATDNVGYANEDGDFESESPGLVLEDNLSLPTSSDPKGAAAGPPQQLPDHHAERISELRRLC